MNFERFLWPVYSISSDLSSHVIKLEYRTTVSGITLLGNGVVLLENNTQNNKNVYLECPRCNYS